MRKNERVYVGGMWPATFIEELKRRGGWGDVEVEVLMHPVKNGKLDTKRPERIMTFNKSFVTFTRKEL